jgi:hypothetical protein
VCGDIETDNSVGGRQRETPKEKRPMPTLTTSKSDPKTGIVLNMLGAPTRQYDPAFDSYLLLHNNGCDNHTLTLTLKIHLNPLSTFGFSKFPVADLNKRLFWMRPWKGAELAAFKQEFKRQCLRWNDRFWLKPPAGFSKLDVKIGNRTVRPNIYCHLYVDLVDSPVGAHRTINLVNLDIPSAERIKHVQPGKLDSGSFRSDEGQYDSLDVKERTNELQDENGVWRKHTKYLTIVHEVGHAIGLPHIGVTHHDPLCQMAIALGDLNYATGGKMTIPAFYDGGSNSSACYANLVPFVNGENVMAGGSKFEASNASPWVDRIAQHTGTKATDWTANMGKILPSFM